MSVVRLNGLDFDIKGSVRRYYPPPFASVFRPSGLQRREGIEKPASFVFPTPIKGMGLARISDVDDPNQAQRIWDSRIQTRFPGASALAILNEAVTLTTPEDFLKAVIPFKGDLVGIFEEDYTSGSTNKIMTRQYDAASDDWTGGVTIQTANANADGLRVFDVVEHKGEIVVLQNGFQSSGITERKAAVSHDTTITDINWAEHQISAKQLWEDSGANSLRKNDYKQQFGKLISFGNTLVLATWDTNDDVVSFWKSTDKAATWTQVGSDLAVNSPVNGKAIYFDDQGSQAPVFALNDGLYAVDIANAEIVKILDYATRAHDDNGRGMVLHYGSLYIPMGDGGMIRLNHLGAGRFEEREIGPTRDDGLPSARQGHGLWCAAVDRWVFMSYGGHAANKNASILAYDILEDAWHTEYYHTAANVEIPLIFISSRDDEVPRLHFVTDGASSAPHSFLAEILASPNSGVSIKRQTSGYVARPEFDGGLARIDGAWLQAYLDAIDLSTGTDGEYINLEYALNGDDLSVAANRTDLGNIVSGDKDRDLGESKRGVSGKSIQVRETYNRDATTNTDSPKGRSLELVYMKKPKRVPSFEFEIDVVATARRRGGGTEEVYADLDTIRESDTLLPFAYGKMKEVQVDVSTDDSLEHFSEPVNTFDEGERRGTVKVLCEQIL